MSHAFVIAGLILAAAAPGAVAARCEQTPAATPKAELTALFGAAARDSAQIVPLILQASTHLAAADEASSKLLGDTLEPFCRRAFFGPERLSGMERLGLAVHTVREGELPGAIAARYRISPGLLGYLNADYDERRLRVGQQLKVLDLSDRSLRIQVDKSRYRLAAWRTVKDGAPALIAFLPVGLGAVESPTPLGNTTIVKRVLDPQWTHPVTKQVFAPKDPGNVLGGYWIALDSAGIGQSGIGLHGFTGAPAADWIAQPASHGCVRMLQADIDRVFHLALEGTRVDIVK